MRRMIAGAKKALHRNKQQNESRDVSSQNKVNQAPLDQVHNRQTQTVFDLSIGPGPPDGYTCWDNTQCGLCSRFLDPWFILRMFIFKFVNVGKASDLLNWSLAGGRCSLCNYLSLRFDEETRGGIPLDANVIVRWDTKDTAIKDGRRDEVTSFNFELSWGLGLGLQGKARSARMNCFTNEGKLNLEPRYLVIRLPGITQTRILAIILQPGQRMRTSGPQQHSGKQRPG
jgi:hypothetical protein